jgi:hypothetical protein
MKGGVTSGVVYPQAIATISEHYRFRKIGGTSAGAIGAVFAAAAEYRRQTDPQRTSRAGFADVAKVSAFLGDNMLKLFQPSRPLRPLFNILIAAVQANGRSRLGKGLAIGGAILRAFAIRLLLALLVAAALVYLWVESGDAWRSLFGLGLLLLLLTGSMLWSACNWVMKRLPAHRFGICSGQTQPGHTSPAFTDWMTDEIDRIAGRDTDGRPLCIGDLLDHGIEVATMTTDLSSGRPYQLPLQTKIHYFSVTEFRRLFPARVVDHLVAQSGKYADPDFDQGGDFLALPIGRDFPVVMVARLSLSFPILIETVPLHRRDFGSGDKQALRRCLFSDGGLSSNFPIHFFDAMMPKRPTFGIALGDWSTDRHGPASEDRILLPETARQSTSLPVRNIAGLGGFVGAILGAAKDWQDNLQSMLPGYADRVVTVLLDPAKEGGLNLTMSQPTIEALGRYGSAAGDELVARFSYANANQQPHSISGFDQHRYARAISLLPKLHDSLHDLSVGLAARPTGGPANAMTGEEVLTLFKPSHYAGLPDKFRAHPLATFAREAAALGNTPPIDHDNLPVADCRIRLQANADRLPRAATPPPPLDSVPPPQA